MKPTHLLLIALCALTVGCKSYTTTETISSEGTADDKVSEAATSNNGDLPEGVTTITTGATSADMPDTKTDVGKKDPLSINGTAKPDLAAKPGATTPPTPGAAAGNSAITAKTLVGKYSGKMLEESIALFLSIAPPEKRAEAESELRSATIALELTADGKYSLLTKSTKASETNKGTWKYDEKTGIATMSAPDMNAEQLANFKARGATDEQIAAMKKQTMECKVSKDGRTLTYIQEQGGMKIGITFAKK